MGLRNKLLKTKTEPPQSLRAVSFSFLVGSLGTNNLHVPYACASTAHATCGLSGSGTALRWLSKARRFFISRNKPSRCIFFKYAQSLINIIITYSYKQCGSLLSVT